MKSWTSILLCGAACLCLGSCRPAAAKVVPYEEVIIDGCHYLATRANYSYYTLAHKGNCPNHTASPGLDKDNISVSETSYQGCVYLLFSDGRSWSASHKGNCPSNKHGNIFVETNQN